MQATLVGRDCLGPFDLDSKASRDTQQRERFSLKGRHCLPAAPVGAPAAAPAPAPVAAAGASLVWWKALIVAVIVAAAVMLGGLGTFLIMRHRLRLRRQAAQVGLCHIYFQSPESAALCTHGSEQKIAAEGTSNVKLNTM